jgi:hypothetical protein
LAVEGIQGRLLLERFNNFLAPKDLTIIKTDCSNNHSCVAWYFEFHKKKICAWVRVTRRAGLGLRPLVSLAKVGKQGLFEHPSSDFTTTFRG